MDKSTILCERLVGCACEMLSQYIRKFCLIGILNFVSNENINMIFMKQQLIKAKDWRSNKEESEKIMHVESSYK